MASEWIPVNLPDGIQTPVPLSETKSRPDELSELSCAASTPEVSNEDLLRFQRQFGLWL
jgi:hypothetical protein